MALCLGALLAIPAALAATPVATKAPEFEELLAQARTQRQVLVIVTLAIEGAAPPDPGTIAAAQQRLLAELAPFHIENIKTYRHLPMLACSVEPVALGYLLASPAVKTIQIDRTVFPQRSGTLPADR